MMSERDFWIAIRQALLTMVAAIERRYHLGKYSQEIDYDLPCSPVNYETSGSM